MFNEFVPLQNRFITKDRCDPPLRFPGGFHGGGNQFPQPLGLSGDYRNNWASQFRLETFDIDAVITFLNDIGLVQGNDDRDTQFQKLSGHEQTAFQIGAVHDVDDHIGAMLENEISRYGFFSGIRSY